MNKIMNTFLLEGNIFKPGIQLRQHGFTYSTCRPFTENTEKIQKFKEII